MKALGLNPTQFADEIGVQRSSISHILSGRNNPSLDIITKILHRYVEVDSNWLVLGKGAMYAKKENTSSLSLFDEIPSENSKNETKKAVDSNSQTTESLEKEIEAIQGVAFQNGAKPQEEEKTIVEKQAITLEKQTTAPAEKNEKQEPVLIEKTLLEEPKIKENKHITKIIIFYSDSTFEELEKK